MKHKIEWIQIPEFKLLENEGHWDHFIVVKEGSVRIDGKVIKFPKGWITDVTSSPKWSRGIVDQIGPHSPAALIHDRLLDLNYDRKYARSVMLEQLKNSKRVNPIVRWWMWFGVWLYDSMK